MTLRFTRWRGPTGRAVPLALAAVLFALPVAANETATPKAKASPVSLRQVASREASKASLTRTSATSSSRAATQAAAGTQSTSFFKTRQGAVALAVMVIGSGYALYSISHDRITSPAKK